MLKMPWDRQAGRKENIMTWFDIHKHYVVGAYIISYGCLVLRIDLSLTQTRGTERNSLIGQSFFPSDNRSCEKELFPTNLNNSLSKIRHNVIKRERMRERVEFGFICPLRSCSETSERNIIYICHKSHNENERLYIHSGRELEKKLKNCCGTVERWF